MRGGVIRSRISETRTRTAIRVTAEQDTTESHRSRDVCIVIVTEICGRTAAYESRNDFAAFSKNNFFNISLGTGFIPNMTISVIVTVIEF